MTDKLFKTIHSLIHELNSEEFMIEEDRQELLSEIAGLISTLRKENKRPNLLIICTHNSRRSQLAEVWIRIATDYFGISSLYSYSGGTEVTAFNPRMVKALARAGLHINQKKNSDNPKYSIHWQQEQSEPQLMFSKKYNDAFNPQSGLIALMVCDHADQNCPIIPNADARFSVQYEDPKYADDTLEEGKVYDSKVREIGREMLFLMRKVKELEEQ